MRLSFSGDSVQVDAEPFGPRFRSCYLSTETSAEMTPVKPGNSDLFSRQWAVKSHLGHDGWAEVDVHAAAANLSALDLFQKPLRPRIQAIE